MVKAKKSKKVSPFDLQEKKKLMDNFIWDEDLILQQKTFTQFKPDHESFAYGLLLSKEIPLYDKNKEIIGKDQIKSPVIITSNRGFVEATKEIEIKNNINFGSIPTQLESRWSIESIKSYLEGDESIPDIDPKELFEKIRKKREDFVFEINPIWYKIDTLWDMGTYFYQLCDVYPIREHRGLAGTGKTKKMMISRNISFNATEIMVNPSEASLFRETHDKHPTKYFDEAEKLFRNVKGNLEPDNRVELINSSYSKGAYVPRIEKIKERYVTIYYDCYSPTQISSIRGLFGATETRAITSISTKNLDKDHRGEKEPNKNDPDWRIIRDYLYPFGLKYFKEFEDLYRDDSLYIDLKIKKRDLQIWKPLLALAELIDHTLFLEVVEFAERQSIQRREDFIPEDHIDYKTLKIVKEMIGVSEIVRPKEISKRFQDLYDEKFREKVFSNRLDTLGFKELRKKDMKGSLFLISKESFRIRVEPVCPELIEKREDSVKIVKIGEKRGSGGEKG